MKSISDPLTYFYDLIFWYFAENYLRLRCSIIFFLHMKHKDNFLENKDKIVHKNVS